MRQLWKNAEGDSKAPTYHVQERKLRIYRQGLEVTANNEGNSRTGETYGLRSLGVQRDPYVRETGKPGKFAEYIFGRRDDSYRMAA